MDALLKEAHEDIEDHGGASGSPDGKAVHRDRSMTVDLSDASDDSALQITITGFAARDNAVYFTVETSTTLTEQFANRSMKVSRKHDDFTWLHDRFAENPDLAGHILPAVPAGLSKDQEKHAAGVLSTATEGKDRLTEETNRRAAKLQRFLRLLAQMPKLRTDPNMIAFLEYEALQPRKAQGWFNFSSSANPKIDTDEKFTKLRQENTIYQKNIQSAFTAYQRTSAAELVLGNAFSALAPTTSSLQETDPNPQWASLLNQLAEVCKITKGSVASLTSAVEDSLGDVLADQVGMSNSIASMHNRRLLLLQRAVTAKQNLAKAEAKAKSQPKPERQEEVQLLARAETEAKDALEQASATALAEVVRTRNTRIADYRQALSNLADTEVEHSRTRLDNLKAILAALN